MSTVAPPSDNNSTTTDDYYFVCSDVRTGYNETCVETCLGLVECDESCPCAIVETNARGDWGQFMDVFLALLPIIFLIVVTIKRTNPWATSTSLPVAAGLLWLIRLMYFQSDVVLTCGAVVLGIHEAWTPLSIMAGAILLFETMEQTRCLPYMMREMKILTNKHAIAELMLMFAFCYLVEGASGFGTPVALAAPMLVSTGKPAKESVIVLLLFNTFATVWGAVGTPIWFGLGSQTDPDAPNYLSHSELLEVSQKSAVALCFSGFILIPFILTILVPLRVIKSNIIFVLSAIAVTIGPSLGIAFVSYEFPSLIGGLIGFLVTALLIHFKIGLKEWSDLDLPGGDTDSNDGDGGEDEEAQAGSSGGGRRRIHLHDIFGFHHANNHNNDTSIKTSQKDMEEAGIGNNNSTNNGKTIDDDDGTPNGETTGDISTSNSSLHPEDPRVIAHGAVQDDGIEIHKNVSENDQDDGDETAEQEKEEVPPLDDNEEDAEAMIGNDDADEDEEEEEEEERDEYYDELGPRNNHWKEMLFRTFPIWGVVLILILTRVDVFHIKPYLTKKEPYFEILFGTYGTFRLSVSIVFQLLDILTYPGLGWKYELLYIPFLIPFVLVSVMTMAIYRKDLKCKPRTIFSTVFNRLKKPAIALMGALVLVQLMIRSGTAAPSFILGITLSEWFKGGFVVISPLLGALGSFFSGSTTVSNLTFGTIQQIAAQKIGTSVTAMLALQTVGASAGNGICLNNIIAACAVVGLNIGEGQILAKTYKYVLLNATIALVVMLIFYLRF